mgnify:CR=1 FL=1
MLDRATTEPGGKGPCPAGPLDDDTLFDLHETAEMLRLRHRTLQEWRRTGKGPRCVRYGARSVFYRLGDIRDFIRAGMSPAPRRESSSDA